MLVGRASAALGAALANNVPKVMGAKEGGGAHGGARRVYEDQAVGPLAPLEGQRGEALAEELRKGPTAKELSAWLKEHFGEAVGGARKARELAAGLAGRRELFAREALLMAIDDGLSELAEHLVALIVRLPPSAGQSLTAGLEDSPYFPVHVTPLMLACLRNDFHLVGVFLKLGIRLKQPHLASCLCAACVAEVGRGESAERALARIDNFRALASSAYILLSSHDPLLLAFDLSQDLHTSMDIEPHNRDKYKQILKGLQGFSARLASQLRSAEEVKLVMRKSEGIQLPSNDFPLPRLRLALDSYMKEFVATFPIQTELYRVWDGDWCDMRVVAGWRKCLRYLVHLLFPLSGLLHLVSGGRLVKSYRSPRARFVSYGASYALFLLALIYRVEKRDKLDVRGPTKDLRHMAAQMYVWAYIAGLIMWDFLRVLKYGPQRFLSVWWASANVIMYLFYIVAFGAWVEAWYRSEREGVRSLARSHWAWFDPQLIYEAAFGLGTVLAVSRILYFLQLTRAFGPLVISVGRCVKDIGFYCLVILIVIFSFACGINFIYEPYQEDDSGSFSGLRSSVMSLYWSFFGHLSPTSLRLSVDSEASNDFVGYNGINAVAATHWLTFQAGRLVVVVYNVFIVVVLLNLMVAMMCNSAGEIITNEDIEWKFIRCQVWAEFMEANAALPPPLNMLWWWLTWIPYFASPRRRFQLWPPNLWYTSPVSERGRLGAYQSLMLTLYVRYVGAKKAGVASSATLDKADAPPSQLDLDDDQAQRLFQPQQDPAPPKA